MIRQNDTAHSSAIGLAHYKTPGQGMLQKGLGRAFCVWCQKDKPRLNGKYPNKMFRCADCLKGKDAE